MCIALRLVSLKNGTSNSQVLEKLFTWHASIVFNFNCFICWCQAPCQHDILLNWQAGVKRVHLLDGTIDAVLFLELFTRNGMGTMVARYDHLLLKLLILNYDTPSCTDYWMVIISYKVHFLKILWVGRLAFLVDFWLAFLWVTMWPPIIVILNFLVLFCQHLHRCPSLSIH